jgi:hypothetical protein
MVTEESSDRIRLHISPFTATLYENIIPKSLQPLATNISFHQVQTFPERAFGYVELPRADAENLRKKLNGFTLRGQKMAISEAKVERKRRKRGDDDEKEEEPAKRSKKDKKKSVKSKKKNKEIEGFELPDERIVKRGWTEEPNEYHKNKREKATATIKSSSSTDKSNKKDGKEKPDKTPRREKSKYSSKPEVLFKQKLPEAVLKAQKADGKEKKSKNTKQPRNITIIHEFEKNKPVPSFLKSDVSSKASATHDFVPGKGWVDAAGNLVEAVEGVKQKREDRIAKMKDTPVEIKIKPVVPREPAQQGNITAGAKTVADYNSDDDDESSVVSSESSVASSSDSEDEDDDESIQQEEKENASASPSSEKEEGNNDAMDIDNNSTPPPREIHPLEALFKKQKQSSTTTTETTPRPAPIKTSFSFFGNGDDDDEDDENADSFDTTNKDNNLLHEGYNYPSTPYTRTRDIRSAAPTPDTAAIGRKFSFSFAGAGGVGGAGGAGDDNNNSYNQDDYYNNNNDGHDQGYDNNANMQPLGAAKESLAAAAAAETEDEIKDFQTWFWENRGDCNRAWKKRRRDVMKVKRQRENKRLSRRVI